jgi:hypothetical protein
MGADVIPIHAGELERLRAAMEFMSLSLADVQSRLDGIAYGLEELQDGDLETNELCLLDVLIESIKTQRGTLVHLEGALNLPPE